MPFWCLFNLGMSVTWTELRRPKVHALSSQCFRLRMELGPSNWRVEKKGENKISGWWGWFPTIFRSQFFLIHKHMQYDWLRVQKIPRAQAPFFGWLYQTLGKSMGINQRPSPQGDDGALLASVCDEGVRVYDADHRYKVVQELEKVWRQKEMMGWWLRFRQIFREMFRYIIIYVCIHIYIYVFAF